MVIRHCKQAGIFWQGLRHDLSKYSPSEFVAGARYYQGTRSPNEGERIENGYSAAWLHHKGRNRHHFEYWTDYSHETRQLVPIEMPLCYVAEMFCDRLAASKIYQGENYTQHHPLEYYLRAKGKRFINQNTAALLEKWLRILDKDGEEAAFADIRRTLKK